jgi:hypothetical protein
MAKVIALFNLTSVFHFFYQLIFFIWPAVFINSEKIVLTAPVLFVLLSTIISIFLLI